MNDGHQGQVVCRSTQLTAILADLAVVVKLGTHHAGARKLLPKPWLFAHLTDDIGRGENANGSLAAWRLFGNE